MSFQVSLSFKDLLVRSIKIAKKNVKYKDKTGTYNWQIESGIDTDVMGGNTPKIILFYQHEDETGFPSSGGNTFWLKHKNGKPYTPQEAKALVNKISNKKIHDFQRKSQKPSGSGQHIYYVDGKFLREGKLTEGKGHVIYVLTKELEKAKKILKQKFKWDEDDDYTIKPNRGTKKTVGIHFTKKDKYKYRLLGLYNSLLNRPAYFRK